MSASVELTIPRVLIVDDDKNLCYFLSQQIDKKTYQTDFAYHADLARKKLRENHYDLIILDIVMPGISGLEFAREVRKRYPETPFIFLTAQNELKHKAEGFELGAEDFVAKPFHLLELLYRMKATLRRTLPQNLASDKFVFKIGIYTFNYHTRTLCCSSSFSKVLSIKEADLLYLLCSKQNEFIPREVFLERIWGKTDEFSADSMDVYLTRLRKYLSLDPAIKIENLRRSGFRINYEAGVEIQ